MSLKNGPVALWSNHSALCGVLVKVTKKNRVALPCRPWLSLGGTDDSACGFLPYGSRPRVPRWALVWGCGQLFEVSQWLAMWTTSIATQIPGHCTQAEECPPPTPIGVQPWLITLLHWLLHLRSAWHSHFLFPGVLSTCCFPPHDKLSDLGDFFKSTLGLLVTKERGGKEEKKEEKKQQQLWSPLPLPFPLRAKETYYLKTKKGRVCQCGVTLGGDLGNPWKES